MFSYRHEIGKKVLVERYQEKELSYMQESSYHLLQQMDEKEFIPLTSRTIEQYQRISFFKDGRKPRYALLNNGGILLVNGKVDEKWKTATFHMVKKEIMTMKRITDELEKFGTVKWQDELVIFLKLFREQDYPAIEQLAEENHLMVFRHFSKVYLCSKKLNKGYAVKRFMTTYLSGRSGKQNDDVIIVAGDAKVDLSMMMMADVCVFSKSLQEEYAALKKQYYLTQYGNHSFVTEQQMDRNESEKRTEVLYKIQKQEVIFTENEMIGETVLGWQVPIFQWDHHSMS